MSSALPPNSPPPLIPPAAPPATPLRVDADVIGLVGIAHMVSHFSQLILAPLFPLLKAEFGVSYTELAFLLTLFFVVSCGVQAASGFWVDRFGPRPILFAGLALLGTAAFGYAISTSYWMLAGFAIMAGAGNGVFHPVDYTLLNRKISSHRLGHAYSVHGITGSLGWALAPALMLPLAHAYSWRVAVAVAGALAFVVLALLLFNRKKLVLAQAPSAKSSQSAEGNFAFLRLPAVWMCFSFFFWYAAVLSVVQAFAPEAARQLHDFPVVWVANSLAIYMLLSAAGMVLGGFLAADPSRCAKIVALAFAVAASLALLLALGSLEGLGTWVVPALFGAMGFASGIAGPSRDLLVKQSTPANATGRVYGVLLGLALLQGVLIVSALNVRRARSTALA